MSLYGQIIELLIDSCKQCIKRIRHPKQQQKGTGAIDRSNHQETSVVIENVESTSNCYDISLSVNDFEIGKNQSNQSINRFSFLKNSKFQNLVLKTAVQRASNLVLPIQQEETAVKNTKSNISIDFIIDLTNPFN